MLGWVWVLLASFHNILEKFITFNFHYVKVQKAVTRKGSLEGR